MLSVPADTQILFFQHPGDKTSCLSALSWRCSLSLKDGFTAAGLRRRTRSMFANECKGSVCALRGSDVLTLTVNQQLHRARGSLQFFCFVCLKVAVLDITLSRNHCRCKQRQFETVCDFISELSEFIWIPCSMVISFQQNVIWHVCYSLDCFIWFSQYGTGGNKAVFDGRSLHCLKGNNESEQALQSHFCSGIRRYWKHSPGENKKKETKNF